MFLPLARYLDRALGYMRTMNLDVQKKYSGGFIERAFVASEMETSSHMFVALFLERESMTMMHHGLRSLAA